MSTINYQSNAFHKPGQFKSRLRRMITHMHLCSSWVDSFADKTCYWQELGSAFYSRVPVRKCVNKVNTLVGGQCHNDLCCATDYCFLDD